MKDTLHPPGTFCWNELGTRNAAAAKKFYSSLFGWQMHDEQSPVGVYTLVRVNGQDIAGLYDMSGPMFEGVPPHWMSYVAVASADDTAKKAKSLGGKVMSEPMDIPDVGRMAVIQDPQGATFSLFQAGKHPGAAQLNAAPGTFCWNELGTSDAEGAVKFYTGLFGWQAVEVPMGPMNYTLWKQGGQDKGGMYQLTPEMPMPPHWMGYVLVADCDASAKKAQSLGANVGVPPTDIPGVGRFAIFQDPTGAHLAIIKLG